MSNIDLFNIKLKRYLTQYDYLETLLEETKILFEEYNQKFLQEYYTEEEQNKLAQKKEQEKNNNPKYNVQNHLEDNNIPDEPNEPNEIEAEEFQIDDIDDLILKKLYKKLSLKTHPDKTKDKGDYFKKINLAYKKKNIVILVRIAKELGIDISDIIIQQSNSIISNFDKNIQNLEKQIHDLKHTVAWHWAHASEQEKQMYKEKTRSQ
jgi:hypothetical protein